MRAFARCCSSRGGGRQGILKNPRTGEGKGLSLSLGGQRRRIRSSGGDGYVPVPVQAIIENIDDATIPERRRSENTQQEIEGLMQREPLSRPYGRRRPSSTLRGRRWRGPCSIRTSRPSGGSLPPHRYYIIITYVNTSLLHHYYIFKSHYYIVITSLLR